MKDNQGNLEYNTQGSLDFLDEMIKIKTILRMEEICGFNFFVR